MFTRLLRLVSYIAVIKPPNPPVWSLWGCVMKMLSILRKFARSRARRRVTPSPASMIYWLPLTTSRFDDCARPASGNGPFFVPNVMTRVPFLDDATSLFDCPQAKGDTADAAALAARCRNCLRWRSFIVTSLRSFAIRSRTLWNVGSRLFGLHIGEHHHLCPFLGFVSDELAEFSERTHKRCSAATVRINPGSKPANLITTARTEMVSGRAKGVSCNHLR